MNIDKSMMISAQSRAAEALEAAKSGAMRDLVAWVDATTLEITGPVPEAEKLSWTKKETAARAVLAGVADESQAAMIAIEASVIHLSSEVVSKGIIANADGYTQAISLLTGIRQNARRSIIAAKSVGDTEAALSAAMAAWAAATA
jgi:hypothetical protein